MRKTLLINRVYFICVSEIGKSVLNIIEAFPLIYSVNYFRFIVSVL